MSNLFSDDSSGYRLKTLQILNWGVFDQTVKTLDFNNKSTILTGYNGSGKTTIVDAILTLLIPTNLRWYNLSSDSVKKRERDVDNYVRGAHSNSGDGTTNYLRDKGVISIINGIFEDPENEKSLTLLQVRYYSKEKLESVYAITDKALTIEKLYSSLLNENIAIRSDGRWKKILSSKHETRFFESFTAYKTFFMDRFGFRSDNALKLFAQTVGMKVLGDITGFVRNYMLEDKSPSAEFTALDDEFNKLILIEHDIKKDILKLDRLQNIHNLGEKWNKARALKIQTEKEQLGEEQWFRKKMIFLGEKEKIEGERSKKEHELRLSNNNEEIERCDAFIASLSNNQDTQILDEYDRSLREYENSLERIIHEYERYCIHINKLIANGAAISIPETKEEFYFLKDSVPTFEAKIGGNKAKLDERKQGNLKIIFDLDDSISKMENELSYLSRRNTNIPEEYDAIRNMIATDLKIENLFFLGELVDVSNKEDEFSIAIKEILNKKALCLLVEKKDEKRVLEWLCNHDTGLEFNTITVQELLFIEESPLFSYVAIKNLDNPYKDFIKSFLSSSLDQVLSSNIDSFIKEEKAIYLSYLIKDNNISSKDDRKLPSYLGWNNKKRREELELLIQGQTIEKNELEERNRALEKDIKKADRLLNLLTSLAEEFDDWAKLDKAPYEIKIAKTKELRAEFLIKNKDIEEKHKQLRREKERKEILMEEHDSLIKAINSLDAKIEKIESDLNRLKKENEDKAYDEEAVEIFLSSNEEARKINDIESLSIKHNELSKRYNEKAIKARDEESVEKNNLEKKMNEFINPIMKAEDKELSWSGEYSDLTPEAEYFSDFESEYSSIKEDKLEKLKSEFNRYLTDSLSKSIGSLNEKIRLWDKEIKLAIATLNANLARIPFNKEFNTSLKLEMKPASTTDYREFESLLEGTIPNIKDFITNNEESQKETYKRIRTFLEKYRSDDALRAKVLDIRRKYIFSAKEMDGTGTIRQYYQDTGALSGGEKAKLTYTILAASIAYQFNLDNYDDNKKGPFRFVILDEAFSKSDAKNSEYALELFKELDIQLMVITPRNGINIVEGYVSSLHLIEKNNDAKTSSISSMSIEEYREASIVNA